MTRHPLRALTAGLALAGLLVAGCSSKVKDDTATTGSGVRTGVGITGKTIRLAVLTDLSSVFASQGKDLNDGSTLFWEQQNAKGGVCGTYQVQLQTKDHGYAVQQATQLYAGVKSDVLAIQQTLGSAINTALAPSFAQDKMVNIPSAWARNLTDTEENAVLGSTYDVEMVNVIGYALEQKLIAEGDTVGHIYFEGEFGANALAGSMFMAGRHRLKVVQAKIKPTDADMSAQVINFKAQGAKAILLTASPTQLASAAGVAAAQGLDVPILGNSTNLAPGILTGSSAAAVIKNYVGGYSYAGFDRAAEVLAAYRAKFPAGKPSTNVVWGYAAGDVMREVLDKACASGDLTRAGVLAAKKAITAITPGGGLIVPLDLSRPGRSPGTKTFIERPAKDAPGGLTTVTDAYQAPDVEAFMAGS